MKLPDPGGVPFGKNWSPGEPSEYITGHRTLRRRSGEVAIGEGWAAASGNEGRIGNLRCSLELRW